ncbi:15140_t:CDS:1 [Cetraspora pellucida]|uniref:15140_t:CDS:1 n=1 Tax=Cetraspora pellucida TaxID=1433469 RepID=A0A9N9E1E9_9GLOM|nr:15140_t:CDS:1 [Cetraspora pellucida]
MNCEHVDSENILLCSPDSPPQASHEKLLGYFPDYVNIDSQASLYKHNFQETRNLYADFENSLCLPDSPPQVSHEEFWYIPNCANNFLNRQETWNLYEHQIDFENLLFLPDFPQALHEYPLCEFTNYANIDPQVLHEEFMNDPSCGFTVPWQVPKTTECSMKRPNEVKFVFENPCSPDSPNTDRQASLDKIIEDSSYKFALPLKNLLNQRKHRKISQKPPRAQNKFILFRKEYTARARKENPDRIRSMKTHELSKEASENWKAQSAEVKQLFTVLAEIANEKHKATYPGYVYEPEKKKGQTNGF